MDSLGRLIKELRNKEGLTQSELADKINISNKAISHWETGENIPPLDMLHRLSKFFNVPVSLFIEAIANEKDNDELVKDIIKEYDRSNKRKANLIKFLTAISLLLIISFTGIIVFTNTYNKFKVYNISLVSDDFYGVEGIYIDAKIKNTIFLNNIKIKRYKPNNTDIIYVELYYKDNNTKHLLATYASLDNINYVSLNNELNKHINNIYIKVLITDNKNNEYEYISKVRFLLNFSNSKIYIKDDGIINSNKNTLSKSKIEDILIKNGYVKYNKESYRINNDKQVIVYYIDSCKFEYIISAETNNKYIYYLNANVIDVIITTKGNIEIEKYTYDVKKGKVIKCITGDCNSYKEVMNTLNKEVLYMFN